MKRLNGFTLIETVIYTGLIGMLLTAFVMATWQIAGTTDRDHERQAEQENANFVTSKINWIMNTIPMSTGSLNGQTLQGVASFELNPNVPANHVKLDVAGGRLRLWTDTNGDGVIDASDQYNYLTDNHVTVSDFQVWGWTSSSQVLIYIEMTLTGKYTTTHYARLFEQP